MTTERDCNIAATARNAQRNMQRRQKKKDEQQQMTSGCLAVSGIDVPVRNQPVSIL